MRKGSLEFAILLLIAAGDTYAGELIADLRRADLIVVEGTLYPLLNRLKREGLLDYSWKESKSGPPRKYYILTPQGKITVDILMEQWKNLNASLTSLIKNYEKNS